MKQVRNQIEGLRLAVNVKMLVILIAVSALSVMAVWDYRALTSAYPQLATGYAQSLFAAIAATATVTWLSKQM